MPSIFKSARGYSLFEILVVIVLLGFLILASFVFIPAQVAKVKDARRKTDLEKIKIAFYDYYFDAGCFPESLPDCGQSLTLTNMDYLNNFPCDPNGEKYGYQVAEGSCSQWFKVLANLENEKENDIVKVGCQYGCGPECSYNYGISSSNIRVNEGCVTYYACTPSGVCVAYENPDISQCPRVFENDPTCEDVCDERSSRCHDERGKRTPEEE